MSTSFTYYRDFTYIINLNQHQLKKTHPRTFRDGLFIAPSNTYSPIVRQYHRRRNINYRDRNGNGFFISTIVTGEFLAIINSIATIIIRVIKLFDKLVPVS